MELVTLLETTGDPAFVSSHGGRLVVWNYAAERLLGYPAESVLGRPCHEVIGGRDSFGNLYCRNNCNLRKMIRRHEAIQSFRLAIRNASGELILAVCSVLAVCESAPCVEFSIVHLLQPVEVRDCPTRAESDRDSDPRCNPSDGYVCLTPRETEVLRLLAQGRATGDMANHLCLSKNTVRTHIQNLLRKLEAHNKLEAVALARDHDLI